MNRLIVVALLGIIIARAAGDEPKKPAPKLPLGKETTYVTGPLDKDGYIDYEAALNERLGKGITPDHNANVLIWKALGPRVLGGRMPADYFKQLGIEEPPARGENFVNLEAYSKDHLKLEQKELDALLEQQTQAIRRPWSARQFPHLDSWLNRNEKPLEVIHQAVRR